MIKKALLYSFSSKYITLLAQIGTTLVLARILTPQHIGLFAIASVVTGFAQMFRDFGISEYIVKEKTIDSRNLSAAFTASLIIAWPIAFCLALSAPHIAQFYSDEAIIPLIIILSLNVALSPFGSITMSTLRREMDFKPISYANISSTVVNSITSIGFAVYDFGPLSLAISSVLGTITTVIVIGLYRDKKYKITLRVKGIKRVFLFGSGVGSSNIISYFGDNFMEMLIAKAYSPTDLGIFSKAKSTITLFSVAVLDATLPLITPYFSNAHNNSNALATAYLKSTQPILYLSFPFCILMAVAPETIIKVLYGSQWLSASEYILVLALNFSIYSMSVFYDRCLITLDMPKAYFKFRMIFTIMKIALVYLLIDYGIIYILYGLTALFIVRLTWSLISLHFIINLELLVFAKMIFYPAIAALIFFLGLVPFMAISEERGTIIQCLLLLPAAVVWLIFMYKFDPNIKDLIVSLRKN